MPTVLFALFALLAATLAYLALREPLGRVVAAAAALVLLLGFAGLFWWLGSLLREGGVAP
ncbi:MAG TPA: hypothetical protein VF121_10780 [Thermoanaerobaculia bacterium]|nr:hypothetical protein [Thermoanaerobaculia bacterium]